MNTQTKKKTGQFSEQTEGGIVLNNLTVQNTNELELTGASDEVVELAIRNVERLGLTDSVKAFPQELKDQKRWCNWKLKTLSSGRITKMPMDSNIKYSVGAKSDDESTWADLATALSRVDGDTGIGYFFKEPYVGLDLDDVEDEVNRHLEGDEEDNIVSEFINKTNSYTEVSPSGTGIHIILKSELPAEGRRRGGVEMYTAGRFFTVTFDAIGVDYINDDPDGAVTDLHTKYIKVDKPDRIEHIPNSNAEHDLSDEEVIRLVSKSKQGKKFQTLFEGRWEDYIKRWGENMKDASHSEVDLSFANMLAFWTAKDKVQMDRIFRDSGMMRAKWDEMRGHDTYGNIVLDKAIEGTRGVYEKPSSKGKTFKADTSRAKIKDTWKMNNDEPTREDLIEYPLRSGDDTGNAERIVDRYGDIMKYSFLREKFYIYNGQVWQLDNMGQARRLVNQTVEMIEDEDWSTDENKEVKKNSAEDVWEDDGDEGKKDKANEAKMKHVRRSRSRASKTNMLDLVQTYIPVEEDDFDREDYHLNTENGYVDLTTGEFHDSDKEQMFSMIADVKMDKSAKPVRWLQFLDEIFDGDQELIDFMQRAVGYSLTGSTHEQAMFILFGNGRNGKSVFVETIRDIVGSYTKNIQAKSLAIKSDNAPTNDLAKLKGMRLVTSSEPNDGFRFDEGLIKQITGDEVISARFLFKEEFDFSPNFKLWLTTNYKPIIKGTDDGIWRRLMIIPFNVKIASEDVDKELKDKLLEERSGILNWAIEGAVEWFKHKDLMVPDSVVRESDEYRKLMDVVDQFIDEKCSTMNEDYEERAGSLWETYKLWSDESRYESINRNEFGSRMAKRFEKKRKSDGIYYVGVSLI